MLLKRLRFRFRDADDVAAYGDDWRLWDEPELVRLRGRQLIALEELVGKPLAVIMVRLRDYDTLSSMAAMWLTLHREGHAVAWEDFEPAVNTVQWEEVPEEAPLDSGEEETPEPDSSATPPPESATS